MPQTMPTNAPNAARMAKTLDKPLRRTMSLRPFPAAGRPVAALVAGQKTTRPLVAEGPRYYLQRRCFLDPAPVAAAKLHRGTMPHKQHGPSAGRARCDHLSQARESAYM